MGKLKKHSFVEHLESSVLAFALVVSSICSVGVLSCPKELLAAEIQTNSADESNFNLPCHAPSQTEDNEDSEPSNCCCRIETNFTDTFQDYVTFFEYLILDSYLLPREEGNLPLTSEKFVYSSENILTASLFQTKETIQLLI